MIFTCGMCSRIGWGGRAGGGWTEGTRSVATIELPTMEQHEVHTEQGTIARDKGSDETTNTLSLGHYSGSNDQSLDRSKSVQYTVLHTN
jgi:hypothetical protein